MNTHIAGTFQYTPMQRRRKSLFDVRMLQREKRLTTPPTSPVRHPVSLRVFARIYLWPTPTTLPYPPLGQSSCSPPGPPRSPGHLHWSTEASVLPSGRPTRPSCARLKVRHGATGCSAVCGCSAVWGEKQVLYSYLDLQRGVQSRSTSSVGYSLETPLKVLVCKCCTYK